MKAKLYWWKRGGGHRGEFEAEFMSDEFDIKLSDLQNDPNILIIVIEKEPRI